jgi:hypothetical protein
MGLRRKPVVVRLLQSIPRARPIRRDMSAANHGGIKRPGEFFACAFPFSRPVR